MSEENEKQTPEAKEPTAQPDDTDHAVAEADDAAADPPGEEAAAEEGADAEAPAAPGDLEATVADLKDKLLRALAETENVRRRAARDREEATKYGIAGFAREMVSVADNLHRALQSVDAEARENNEALKALVVGVEITEREMLNALERAGVRAIDALGVAFDHNLHEALFQVEDSENPTGTVVQVVQQGFMLNDRLLRPAKVGVSRGGPAPAPAAGDEAPAPAEAAQKGSAAAYEKPGDGDSAAGSKLDRKL